MHISALNSFLDFKKNYLNDIKSETIKKFVENKLEFQVYGY